VIIQVSFFLNPHCRRQFANGFGVAGFAANGSKARNTNEMVEPPRAARHP